MYNNFQSRHDPLIFYFKFQILLNREFAEINFTLLILPINLYLALI